MGIPSNEIISERLADSKVTLRCIMDREDVGGIGDLIANPLSTYLRLLHCINGRIFLPKIGIFNFVSEGELAVTYHLMTSISMNLHQMMLV